MTPMTTLSIPIRSRRRARAEALQLLVNLTGATVLVDSGWRLYSEGRVVLGAVSLLAVAALAVATVRTLRHGGEGQSIGWADLFAGLVVLLTSLVAVPRESGHVSRAGIASGIVLVTMGILHGRIEQRKASRHALTLDGEGFRWRVNRFRHVHANWSDVAGLEVAGDRLVLTTRDGRRRRVGLGDLVNRGELIEALAEHASAHDVVLAR